MTGANYGCGYEVSENEFGMFAGPFSSIVAALQVRPGRLDYGIPCIIEYRDDGDRVIYRWEQGEWKKEALGHESLRSRTPF